MEHAIVQKLEGGLLEIYRKAPRYVTVTGIHFNPKFDKLINIDAVMDEMVSRLLGPRETGSPHKPRKGNGNEAAPDGRLPVDLGELIRDGAPIGERSERFFYVVATLKDRGFSVDEIESLLANNPAGIAEKYSGRLRAEIERCFDKAKPNENKDAASNEHRASPGGAFSQCAGRPENNWTSPPGVFSDPDLVDILNERCTWLMRDMRNLRDRPEFVDFRCGNFRYA